MTAMLPGMWIVELTAESSRDVRRRLAERSQPGPNGCLVWTGAVNPAGYGRMPVWIGDPLRRRETGAHRAAWLALMGPIPTGLQIDHLCRNHACVNVEHMEIVTGAVNTKRSDHSNKRGRSGRRPGRAHLHACGKHGVDDGYLFTRPDGYSYWACRICRRDINLRYRARQMQGK